MLPEHFKFVEGFRAIAVGYLYSKYESEEEVIESLGVKNAILKRVFYNVKIYHSLVMVICLSRGKLQDELWQKVCIPTIYNMKYFIAKLLIYFD